MIDAVRDSDLEEIRQLIEAAVRTDVAGTEEEAAFLVADIGANLDWWLHNKESALHWKFVQDNRILGVILIKKYWNLTNLFVHPNHQGQGVGGALLAAGLESCRSRSPRGKLQVNSSANAVGFYKSMGFVQTGPGINRPGGCVPLEFLF